MSTPTSHVPQPPKPGYILGVDIGGQSIKPELYLMQGSELVPQGAWPEKITTVPGLKGHVEQIKALIVDARTKVEQLGGELKSIGIASPGRFDGEGKIKKGTNPNLNRPGDSFDGVNLQEQYMQALGEISPELAAIPLTVANDGNAMLAGMIGHLKSGLSKTGLISDQNGATITPATLNGRRVALFGIGTGLGHAIVQMKKDMNYDFVTDGHASKLWVNVDPEDQPMLAKAAAFDPNLEIITKTPGDYSTVCSEHLFRDLAINAMAGVKSGRDIDPANPEHAAALRFAGKYMGRLIAVIKSGQVEDIVPANEWTAQEKEDASKTSMYLIAGGVGRSRDGARLIAAAKEELKAHGLNDEIKMVQMTVDNPATLAAAEMAKSLIAGRQISLK